MIMVRMKMSDINKNLTDEEIDEINGAGNMPIVYDEDSPKMTKKMLTQFHSFDSVPIRISRETLNRAKSIDKDYRGFLSRLLEAAFKDSNLIKKCQ